MYYYNTQETPERHGPGFFIEKQRIIHTFHFLFTISYSVLLFNPVNVIPE
jgi:hypothetical protein